MKTHACLCLALFTHAAFSADPVPKVKAAPEKTILVPYRLTETKHVMVRVKMNGQGPYNFILDTGAPAVFIPKKVAKDIQLDLDKEGWGQFQKFELEGGLVVDKARTRVEDLFQLEGMNGMGLAGFELHGVIGYNVLAKYRITYDFTADKLAFVPLEFDPPAIQGVGKGGQGSLDMMGTLAKVMAGFLGIKPNFEIHAGGFLGIETDERPEGLFVKSLLPKSPAAEFGIKAGDQLVSIRGVKLKTTQAYKQALSKTKPGELLKLSIRRDSQEQTLTVTLGKGF